MEENTPTTLERIQEAAMTEFLDKGFLGASPAADREERRGNYRSFLWLLLQQGGSICLYCRTPRQGTDGPVHGGPDLLC